MPIPERVEILNTKTNPDETAELDAVETLDEVVENSLDDKKEMMKDEDKDKMEMMKDEDMKEEAKEDEKVNIINLLSSM